MAIDIRELTKERHRSAERAEFVRILLSGAIKPRLYATYLWNQHIRYYALEVQAEKYGLLEGLESIKRSQRLYEDFQELWEDSAPPQTTQAAIEYQNYVKNIQNKSLLMTHIYVHHVGDMSGGQIIAKRVPGSHRFYEFEGDIPSLKDKIKSRITEDMVEEANRCFDFVIHMFNELL